MCLFSLKILEITMPLGSWKNTDMISVHLMMIFKVFYFSNLNMMFVVLGLVFYLIFHGQ